MNESKPSKWRLPHDTAEQLKKNEKKFGIQADITNIKVEPVN